MAVIGENPGIPCRLVSNNSILFDNVLKLSIMILICKYYGEAPAIKLYCMRNDYFDFLLCKKDFSNQNLYLNISKPTIFVKLKKNI